MSTTVRASETGAAASGRIFGNALCAIDGHPGSYRAVAAAADLAGEGGRVTVLAVTSYRRGGDHRSPRLGPLKVKAILDQAREIASARGVTVVAEVDPATPPARVILEWAESHDVLAMGAPTTGWFEGMFTPSATVAALHHLPAPLLVTKGEDGAPARAEHVLVATDGSESSDALVRLAARIARERSARLTLVHALHDEDDAAPARVGAQPQAAQGHAGTAGELLVAAGQPWSVVLDAASELSPSLLVMGTRGLEGLRTLGSQSRRVVHATDTPVLLVAPEHLEATG